MAKATEAASRGGRIFPSTNWSLILEGRGDPARRRVALGELVEAYWAPLYCYARRRGKDPETAKDVVQGFLASLVEYDVIERLDPDAGRLRSYLARGIDRYMHKEHRRERALRRGGGAPAQASLELLEQALAEAPLDPAQAYERQWALTVMDRALERLRREYEAGTRRGSFELVAAFFRGDETASYRELSERHGISVAQLKSSLHRARARYRELVRDEVLQTVVEPVDADDELRTLLAVPRQRA